MRKLVGQLPCSKQQCKKDILKDLYLIFINLFRYSKLLSFFGAVFKFPDVHIKIYIFGNKNKMNLKSINNLSGNKLTKGKKKSDFLKIWHIKCFLWVNKWTQNDETLHVMQHDIVLLKGNTWGNMLNVFFPKIAIKLPLPWIWPFFTLFDLQITLT